MGSLMISCQTGYKSLTEPMFCHAEFWQTLNARFLSTDPSETNFGEIFPRKHDDVIKWKHFLRYWPFMRGIHRLPVNSWHKGQWCGALMFSLICAWINIWVNNCEAGELRCHCAHYDVTVMKSIWKFCRQNGDRFVQALTLNMLNCFKDYQRCSHISYHTLEFLQHKKTKFTMEQPYMLLIPHWQYHACWYSGDFRSQGISRHGIDPKTGIFHLQHQKSWYIKITTFFKICRVDFKIL